MVELKKDLPEIFEEFADQRRNSFLAIKKLKEQGVTVLLVEQNAKMALSIADRAYVLETGRIVLEGNARDLLNNDEVKKAYLGN